MNDLVRTDTLFGKRVNLVGNISADLVLESLGKIYIKSRNRAQTLEEFITSIAIEDPNISTSRTLVVDGIEGFDTSGVKNGTFIFDRLSNILYIYLDEELLELINVAPEGTLFVKRSGDTMTGRLAIYVKDGPPLYVNSATLVENLNALYLNGETASSFTRRNKDERIGGKWTFTRPTIFEANTLFEKDIVANSSIGSPSFSSGFSGYGWRMDADTNTLTVDNLVVRKLMLVYELVVNKISATNGSLWITNAGKVVAALKLEIKQDSFFASASSDREKFCTGMPTGYAFIRLGTDINTETILGEYLSGPSGEGLLNRSFWNLDTLQNAHLIIIKSQGEDLSNDTFLQTESDSYHIYNLFSPEFNFNCTFPIITRNAYSTYKQNERTLSNLQALLQSYLEQLEGLTPDSSQYTTILLNISNIQNQINSIPEFNINQNVRLIKSYFKYFGGGDFYYVSFDLDELPVFKPGDIIRCLKWTYNGIKYYDGVICNVNGNDCVILLSLSVLDKKTSISYDSSLNANYVNEWEDLTNYALYKQSSRTKQLSEESNLERVLLGIIEKDDSIVLMGNLWDTLRLNAVYITSTDNGAPYIDVLSGVNRPDYSVIYYVPVYKTIKLNKSEAGNIVGKTYLTDVPYTGNYYILDSTLVNQPNFCDYTYFLYNNRYYLGLGNISANNLPSGAVLVNYLNRNPNEYTATGDNSQKFNILLEDGSKILMYNNDRLALLEQINTIVVTSTRTTKTRLGNLDGIQDEMFPIDRLPYGYGLYGLNVFLTGEFYLNNGQAVADIGKEAIQFAIASSKAGKESLNILERDLKRADDLLRQNVYTKGDLLTAGMRIGTDSNNNPGIVLWGNKIVIATSQNELVGDSAPTALFADGKIQAKFIAVSNAHSIVGVAPKARVILIEYLTDDGLKFYKEEVIYSKNIAEEEEEPVYKNYYKLSYRTPSGLAAGTEIEYTGSLDPNGYATYGWNLEAMGDGYLAFGKINWKTDGTFNINIDNNASLVIKSNNKEKFKISNTSIRKNDDLFLNSNSNLIDLDNKSCLTQDQICPVSLYQDVHIDLRENPIEFDDQLISIKLEVTNVVLFQENTCSYNNDNFKPYWADNFEIYQEDIEVSLIYTESTELFSQNTLFDKIATYYVFGVNGYKDVERKGIVLGNVNAILIRWKGVKIKSFDIKITIEKLDFKAEIGQNFFSARSGKTIFIVGPDGLLAEEYSNEGSIFSINNDDGILLKSNIGNKDCGVQIKSKKDPTTQEQIGALLLIEDGSDPINLIDTIKDFKKRITALESHA